MKKNICCLGSLLWLTMKLAVIWYQNLYTISNCRKWMASIMPIFKNLINVQ